MGRVLVFLGLRRFRLLLFFNWGDFFRYFWRGDGYIGGILGRFVVRVVLVRLFNFFLVS